MTRRSKICYTTGTNKTYYLGVPNPMIPALEDIETESTVQGEKIAMTFDENSLVHLMTVLTDLYSDPELAVLREYSTNARDSHIEAGEHRPIEVTLPSALNPFLSIKDYGVGLTPEDIASIYSKYGASTKRETNEQTGVLGLGCKSALTYGSQFTLVGIKDGQRTTVSIARDEEGAGSMTIVESEGTEEPNGVEVLIPTKRHHNFEWKATQLFRFWEPGTVLVNGKEPDPLDGMKVSGDLLVVEHLEQSYVVMGGVPYPVEFETPLHQDYKLVLFAGLGEVNFTPSREALQYTKRTKERILRAEEELKTAVEARAQQEVEEAETPREAFYRSIKWRRAMPKLDVSFTYKKEEIPAEFTCPEGERIVVSSSKSDVLSRHSRYNRITAPTLLNSIIVHGYKMSNFTAQHKRKLNQWALENERHPESYVLTESKIDSVWLDPANTVAWDVVKAIKLPNESSNRGGGPNVAAGFYHAYESGTYVDSLAAEEIDTELPLFYFATNDFFSRTSYGSRITYDSQAIEIVREDYPDCTIVVLGSNRVKKFCRDFPAARLLTTELREIYGRRADALGPEVYKAHALKRRNSFATLDSSKVDDPELAAAILLLQTIDLKEALAPLTAFRNLLYYIGASDRLTPEEVDDPFKRYPLLECVGYQNEKHPHIYLYLNAAFAQYQTEKE